MPDDNNSPAHWLKLWFSRIGESTLAAEQSLLQWLTPSEQVRLARIGHDNKRREYLLSRVLMRHALNECFQRGAQEWRFEERGRAAPAIDELPDGVHISLSHSGGYVCFGIANCELGIDIEVVKPRRDLLASAKMFMDPGELDTLGNNDTAAMDYFYRCWCAKEACYKSLTQEQQASTALSAIRYVGLHVGEVNRYLIEGDSNDFRFAAAMAQPPSAIRQQPHLAPVAVSIKDFA